jgi:hypothetical protein
VSRYQIFVMMYLWAKVGFVKREFQVQFSVMKGGIFREGYSIIFELTVA